MAFLLHMRDTAQTPPIELIACDDIAVTIGMALAFSSGHAIESTGTTKPTHICMIAKTVATDGDKIPAIRIAPDMIFKSALSADSSSIAIGTKYTTATGGLVTATTSSGTFEITGFDGKVTGDAVYGRFS